MQAPAAGVGSNFDNHWVRRTIVVTNSNFDKDLKVRSSFPSLRGEHRNTPGVLVDRTLKKLTVPRSRLC